MPYKYSTYLKQLHYNKTLDPYWYDELKNKLNRLEDYKIMINISELNHYLYDRYKYEHCDINTFDDTKYNIEKYMQIIEYNKKYNYDADDEMCVEKEEKTDKSFNIIMNGLAKKLEKFTMAY